MTAGSKYSTCRRASTELSCRAWLLWGSMPIKRFSKLYRSTVSKGTSLQPALRADLAVPAAVIAGWGILRPLPLQLNNCRLLCAASRHAYAQHSDDLWKS